MKNPLKKNVHENNLYGYNNLNKHQNTNHLIIQNKNYLFFI